MRSPGALHKILQQPTPYNRPESTSINQDEPDTREGLLRYGSGTRSALGNATGYNVHPQVREMAEFDRNNYYHSPDSFQDDDDDRLSDLIKKAEDARDALEADRRRFTNGFLNYRPGGKKTVPGTIDVSPGSKSGSRRRTIGSMNKPDDFQLPISAIQPATAGPGENSTKYQAMYQRQKEQALASNNASQYADSSAPSESQTRGCLFSCRKRRKRTDGYFTVEEEKKKQNKRKFLLISAVVVFLICAVIAAIAVVVCVVLPKNNVVCNPQAADYQKNCQTQLQQCQATQHCPPTMNADIDMNGKCICTAKMDTDCACVVQAQRTGVCQYAVGQATTQIAYRSIADGRYSIPLQRLSLAFALRNVTCSQQDSLFSFLGTSGTSSGNGANVQLNQVSANAGSPNIQKRSIASCLNNPAAAGQLMEDVALWVASNALDLDLLNQVLADVHEAASSSSQPTAIAITNYVTIDFDACEIVFAPISTNNSSDPAGKLDRILAQVNAVNDIIGSQFINYWSTILQLPSQLFPAFAAEVSAAQIYLPFQSDLPISGEANGIVVDLLEDLATFPSYWSTSSVYPHMTSVTSQLGIYEGLLYNLTTSVGASNADAAPKYAILNILGLSASQIGPSPHGQFLALSNNVRARSLITAFPNPIFTKTNYTSTYSPMISNMAGLTTLLPALFDYLAFQMPITDAVDVILAVLAQNNMNLLQTYELDSQVPSLSTIVAASYPSLQVHVFGDISIVQNSPDIDNFASSFTAQESPSAIEPRSYYFGTANASTFRAWTHQVNKTLVWTFDDTSQRQVVEVPWNSTNVGYFDTTEQNVNSNFNDIHAAWANLTLL